MEIVLALVIGGLYAAGIYMMLRRSLVKLLIGLALLSHAANLLIFTAARLTRAGVPIIGMEQKVLEAPYADPLPQALILTAIVISFGVTAFALALSYRTYKSTHTDDLDRLKTTDESNEPKEAIP
ncbi:MAG: Na+/H+ antiporter subunit C [Chloroflexi bacterium]|nr:Na+/H+ antiporter subunit C [Chloroflexota bacterium]